MLEIAQFSKRTARKFILEKKNEYYFTGDLITLLEENTDRPLRSNRISFTGLLMIKDWLLSTNYPHAEEDSFDGSSGNRTILLYFNENNIDKIYIFVDVHVERPEEELSFISRQSLISLIDQWVELYHNNTKLFLTYDGNEYKLHGENAEAKLLKIAKEQAKKDPNYYLYPY